MYFPYVQIYWNQFMSDMIVLCTMVLENGNRWNIGVKIGTLL